MSLGGLLVGMGLVTLPDLNEALERQRVEGGRLGENLIALGFLTAEQLMSVIRATPPIPSALSDTGIPPRSLLNLMLKFMHLEACETVPELAGPATPGHRAGERQHHRARGRTGRRRTRRRGWRRSWPASTRSA